MAEDSGIVTDVIIPIITIGIGVATTKWITNDWQKRKDRSEIKRKILTDFEESFARRYTSLGNFYSILNNAYLKHDKLKYINNVLDFDENFPKNEKDQFPSFKLSDEYNHFENDQYEITYAENRFIRSTNFYYLDDVNLKNQIPKIKEQFDDIMSHVRVVMNMKTQEEYFNLLDLIKTKLENIKKDLTNLERYLIDSKPMIK